MRPPRRCRRRTVARFRSAGSTNTSHATELLAELGLLAPTAASPAEASFAALSAAYKRLYTRADIYWRNRDTARAERTTSDLIVGLAAGYALGDRHSLQPSRPATTPAAAVRPVAPGADDLFGLAQTGERPNRHRAAGGVP
jgi:hypothetical protein